MTEHISSHELESDSRQIKTKNDNKPIGSCMHIYPQNHMLVSPAVFHRMETGNDRKYWRICLRCATMWFAHNRATIVCSPVDCAYFSTLMSCAQHNVARYRWCLRISVVYFFHATKERHFIFQPSLYQNAPFSMWWAHLQLDESSVHQRLSIGTVRLSNFCQPRTFIYFLTLKFIQSICV